MESNISGKEALIALANGEEVQWVSRDFEDWHPVDPNTSITKVFLNEDHIAKCELKFRLKPKTILLNGVEVPKPFEPKNKNEKDFAFEMKIGTHVFYWKKREDFEQVVAALRKVFGGV